MEEWHRNRHYRASAGRVDECGSTIEMMPKCNVNGGSNLQNLCRPCGSGLLLGSCRWLRKRAHPVCAPESVRPYEWVRACRFSLARAMQSVMNRGMANFVTQAQLRAYQTLSSFSATAVVLLISLGTSIVLARTLGPEGRGLLLALTFWPALLSALLNLSLNEATAFQVARRVGSPQLAAVVSASGQLVVALSLIATIASAIALSVASPILPGGYADIILFYVIAFIPLSQGEQWARSILQGRGAIISLNALRIVQPTLYLALLLTLSTFWEFDVISAMFAAVIALLVSLLIGTLAIRPSVFSSPTGLYREIVRTGWQFHKPNILFYAASEFDKVIVLVLLTTMQAGLFAVAVAVSSIGTGVVLQSLGLRLMRDMASAEGEAGRRRVFIATVRAAFVLLLVGNSVAAALAPWAIPFLYGGSFAEAVPVAVLLLGMGALKGARQMVDKTLRAIQHTRTGMISEVTALTVLVGLGSIGAVVGGLEGFALGTLIAQAIALLVVLPLACGQFGARPRDLWPFQRAALDDFRAFMRPRLPSGKP